MTTITKQTMAYCNWCGWMGPAASVPAIRIGPEPTDYVHRCRKCDSEDVALIERDAPKPVCDHKPDGDGVCEYCGADLAADILSARIDAAMDRTDWSTNE